jgi:hypothetical protein
MRGAANEPIGRHHLPNCVVHDCVVHDCLVHVVEQRYGAEAEDDHKCNGDDPERYPPPEDERDHQYKDKDWEGARVLSWAPS